MPGRGAGDICFCYFVGYLKFLKNLNLQVKKYRQRAAKSVAQLNLSHVGDVSDIGVNILSRYTIVFTVGIPFLKTFKSVELLQNHALI